MTGDECFDPRRATVRTSRCIRRTSTPRRRRYRLTCQTVLRTSYRPNRCTGSRCRNRVANVPVSRLYIPGLTRRQQFGIWRTREQVDVIAATTSPAAVAARNATRTIPVVMFAVGDPVALGLIASLARPGGNVTGLTYSVGLQAFVKQLELLKETVPKVRRVAVLSNPANPGGALTISSVKAAARSMRLELQFLEVRGPDEFDRAFAAMAQERAEAILVLSDPMFGVQRARLAELAAKSRLPSMHGVRELVEAGGLMNYGPSIPDNFRRGAGYVDKILRGAKPGDLPVQQPTKFEFIINLKTAKALGLAIPPSVLVRADEVIQ